MTSMITPGSLVRSTRQITNDNAAQEWTDDQILELLASGGGRAVVAEPGELGRVVHVEGEELIVAWQRGHGAVSCFLGDDCAPFMTLHQGGSPTAS